jgi:hypothetical protein
MSTMYAVHVSYHYYAGTIGARKSGLIRNDAGDVLVFASRESASEYAGYLQPSEHYRLSNGEYSPPSYRVRKYTR